MKSSTTAEFWTRYRLLPDEVRAAARRAYRLWSQNPRAPALRFKKVRDVYAVRIGTTGYRALASTEPDGFLWFWIGPHDEYLRLLGSD